MMAPGEAYPFTSKTQPQS